MTDTDKLLTDAFVQFSDGIKALYQEKKTLKEEFKKVYGEAQAKLKTMYDEFQAQIKDIDARASKLAEEFEKEQPTIEAPTAPTTSTTPNTVVVSDDPDGALATVTSQSKKTGKK